MSSAPFLGAGSFNQYAELQSKSETPDAGGGDAVTWVTDRRIWCSIRPLSSTQRLEGMQRESQVTHEIFVRYQDDTQPDTIQAKRILNRGEAFNITAAWIPHEALEYVQMHATRGVAT